MKYINELLYCSSYLYLNNLCAIDEGAPAKYNIITCKLFRSGIFRIVTPVIFSLANMLRRKYCIHIILLESILFFIIISSVLQ